MWIINKKKLGLIIVILLIISAGTLWAKYEPKEDLIEFYKGQKDTEETIILYHERMNELFNGKIDLLINDYDEKAIDKAPEDGEECTPENVSTYCAAESAVDEFFAFQEAMFEKQKEFEFPKTPEGEEVPSDNLITELASLQSARIDFIGKETDVAFSAMDAALSSYNELHYAYPLHKKYQSIIKELEKYRDMMAEVRHEMEFFPNKFIDVSTTQCQ